MIVLSDEFYSEIMNHPIPTDIDAVKVLASAPAVLDLFMWLAYRCFLSKREERIPLFGDFGLTAQLGSVEYTRPRRFRAMLQQWLSTIHLVWPECPSKDLPGGSLPPLSAQQKRSTSAPNRRTIHRRAPMFTPTCPRFKRSAEYLSDH